MNRTRIIISIIMAAAALAIASCSELDLTEDAQLIDRNTSTAAPSTPVQQQAQGSTRTAVPTWEPVIPATNTPLTSTSFIGISPTATLDPVGTASGREEPGPGSATVNGLTEDEIIVLGEGVAENVRRIYDRGQELERDPHAFSKLGDSLIATPNFFTQFDSGDYDLGEYDYLQPAIDYFAGSFERYGVALRPGLHAWAVFDPLWANKDWCEPNEDLLSCEIRYHNPGVLMILLGSNDAGNPPGFAYNMRQVVEFVIEEGIIPIIVTKADRFEGPDNTNNDILRQIAADFEVPLWDFDLVAQTIPNRGLMEDQIHLTPFTDNDFTLPEAFETGHGLHNLTGLMALNAVRRIIEE